MDRGNSLCVRNVRHRRRGREEDVDDDGKRRYGGMVAGVSLMLATVVGVLSPLDTRHNKVHR